VHIQGERGQAEALSNCVSAEPFDRIQNQAEHRYSGCELHTRGNLCSLWSQQRGKGKQNFSFSSTLTGNSLKHTAKTRERYSCDSTHCWGTGDCFNVTLLWIWLFLLNEPICIHFVFISTCNGYHLVWLSASHQTELIRSVSRTLNCYICVLKVALWRAEFGSVLQHILQPPQWIWINTLLNKLKTWRNTGSAPSKGTPATTTRCSLLNKHVSFKIIDYNHKPNPNVW